MLHKISKYYLQCVIIKENKIKKKKNGVSR